MTPEKASNFLRQTGDVSDISEDSWRGIHHLGRSEIESVSRVLVEKSTINYSVIDMLSNQNNFKNRFRKDLQNEVDKLYGKDTLIIKSVYIYKFVLSAEIDKMLKDTAKKEADNARLEALNRNQDNVGEKVVRCVKNLL